MIQDIGSLPPGASAPNTVITEHAVHAFGLASTMVTTGWLIETAQQLTTAQIHNAQTSAGGAGMSIESKNNQLTSYEVINWATAFGIAIALFSRLRRFRDQPLDTPISTDNILSMYPVKSP